MKKTIAIFTTSRAEFGIFNPLLQAIKSDKDLDYLLFVGGAHLAAEFGMTISEIQKSEFNITDTFDYLLNSDSQPSMVNSLGISMIQLNTLFEKYAFDFVCILGDRIELLSIVTTSIVYKKPIIHLSGGEITEGAIDDQIRHMITKASHIHLTYTDEYVENIIKMGEESWRVHNIGALGVDNFIKQESISRDVLFKELGIDKDKETVLVSFHPSTLEIETSPTDQIKPIFDALNNFNLQCVITAPNAENDRDVIYNYMKNEATKHENYHLFDSLGERRFSSLLKYSEFIIGNSSSGIVYAPYYKVPSINIGNRQKGRIRHESIIDCEYSSQNIQEAIKESLSPEFRERISNMKYKFGGGNSAEKTVQIIKDTEISEKLIIKKLTF